MRNLFVILVIGVVAWQAWGAYQVRTADEVLIGDSESAVTAQLLDLEAASDERSPYQCDGRTHGSEMTARGPMSLFPPRQLLSLPTPIA